MPGRNFYNDLGLRSPYIRNMESLIAFLMGAAIFAALVLLAVGIILFAVYGKFYRFHSNYLMQGRCAVGHRPDILRSTHVRLFLPGLSNGLT